MTRALRVAPIVALMIAMLSAVTVFGPTAYGAKLTPEERAAQQAERNRVKAQAIADKALASIDKALSKGSLGFDKVANAVIANLDKLFSRNVTDFAKYQAAVAKAATQINKDSVRSLAGAAKTILATQKSLQKLNQPEILQAFSVAAAQKTADFVFPSAEALARIQDRLQQILSELEVP